MPNGFCPRLAQATDLLPRMRAELAAAAAHHLLPASFSLDLLPIVDDGIFGYEFLPQQESNTYLTIGCDSGGRILLRKNLYCAQAPSALRLAAVNGRVLSRNDLDAWHRIQPRDYSFTDWASAAQAAWDELAELFPDGPRRSVEIHDAVPRWLDDALAIACEHLAEWDPLIEFCGVPDEAQYGYALTGAKRESGQLVARAPGHWTLRWECAGRTVDEQWASAPPGDGRGAAWACAGSTGGEAPLPRPLLAPAVSGATSGPR